jgi:hypothetical protein
VGEFEKRINAEMEFVDQWAWGINAIAEEDIKKIVDEAKKEFPKLWTDNSDSKIREAKTFIELMKWFEKWFGDPE